MRHKTLKLRYELHDAAVQKMTKEHQIASVHHYDYLVSDYTSVLKPNGEILLKLLPRAIPLPYAEEALKSFHGKLRNKKGSLRAAIKASSNSGSEGVFGFMESSYPFNYCRTTALTAKYLSDFKLAYPFIRSAAKLMKEHMPRQYEAQLAACEQVHPDYIIHGTPFSTLTVNQDVTANYHVDDGDCKRGMGVLATTWAVPNAHGWTLVQENPVEGGLLVFPKYRVAVRVRSTDLLLADVHEVHGVTPINAEPGTWTGLSYVLYLRENMHTCADMSAEIERSHRMTKQTCCARKPLRFLSPRLATIIGGHFFEVESRSTYYL